MVNMMELVVTGIMLVILGISLSIGQTLLGQMLTTQIASSYAYNATSYGQAGINTLAQWQTTIALVVAAAFIIGLLFSAMLGSIRGGV